MQREVVVVSAVRTAIGTFGGALKDVAPTDLAARVLRESVQRAGVAAVDGRHARQIHIARLGVHDMAEHHVADITTGDASALQ